MQDKHAKNSEVPAAGAVSEPREEQSNLMMDDINIPVVATAVALFVVLLAVVVISLQAAFYHYAASERQRKTLPQEDKGTELGAMLAEQRQELYVGLDARRVAQATATGSAPATGSVATGIAPVLGTLPQGGGNWLPIDEAMRTVSREYERRRLP